MSPQSSVVFVCVKNGGKSQMAAALMRMYAAQQIEVHSAGTAPGTDLNQQSVMAIEDAGAGVGDEHPKPIDPDVVSAADRVVLLGAEVALSPEVEAEIEPGNLSRWLTDEPSERGIEGMDRMRLILADIDERVRGLRDDLLGIQSVPIRDGAIRLGQLLKLAGVVPDGAMARMVIENGEVRVDGEIVMRRGTQVRPGMVVRYSGFALTPRTDQPS
ncbi:MAG: RNA-binding S4 domain-containing protein [Ornithinimicrobium sp.]